MPDENATAPSPRRRRRRRRAAAYPLKLLAVAVAGSLGAWCLFLLLAKAAHPYLLGHEENKKVAALQERLDRQHAENVALRKRIAYLKSPEGAESEARRAGYHRPGEVVYLMDPAVLTSPTPAPAERR
jgi:cell division protein FtsB